MDPRGGRRWGLDRGAGRAQRPGAAMIDPARVRIFIQPLPERPPPRPVGPFWRFDPTIVVLGIFLGAALIGWLL